MPSAAAVIDRTAHQAVFLANGSTYLDNLARQGDGWFLPTDIYLLSLGVRPDRPQLRKRGSEPQVLGSR